MNVDSNELDSNECNQKDSFTAAEAAIYSASVVDKATVCCLWQETLH